jgi:predicted MFS family arabinose efflux permease
MSTAVATTEEAANLQGRTRLLRIIVISVFLLFFQTYMVAPLIPSLAIALNVSRAQVALLIPAYTIPYAIGGLLLGALSDRVGRRFVLFFGLASFPIVGIALALAPSFRWLLGFRILSGVANVGIVVTALSLIGDLFPMKERGQALGWLFGAVAGGGAFGSTFGGILKPLVGWRGLFGLVAAAGFVALGAAQPLWNDLADTVRSGAQATFGSFFSDCVAVLSNWRAARTYSYVFLNAVFHSGVFTWLGVLLHDRFGLSDVGIGLALLGYGVPGLLLGPAIGRVVDRHGRRWMIPAGMLVAATSAALLAPRWPLLLTAVAITILSLGFDMCHPLLAGIATTLDERRRGQAMGLNAFSIFFGLGCGSLLFGWLTSFGMSLALASFAIVQASLGLLAFLIFRTE